MKDIDVSRGDNLVTADDQLPPILDGHHSPAVVKKVEGFYFSVAQMREAWILKNSNPNTQRSYRAATNALIEFLGLRWPDDAWQFLKVSVADIRDWRDHMELNEKKAPATLNHRICMVSAFYTFMREMAIEHRLPILVPNPAHKNFIERPTTKPVNETKDLTSIQVQRLRRMPDGESLVDYRDRAILVFYAFTAARIGTGCRLEVHDFIMDTEDPVMHIQEKGKKNTKRPLGIHSTAADVIQEYLTMAQITSGPLFRRQASPNPHSKKLGAGGLSETAMYEIIMKYLRLLPGAIYTVAEKVENKDGEVIEVLKEKCRYSPHSLRATAITQLALLNIPILDIRDMAGHAQTRTTETYVKRHKATRGSVSHQLPY